MMTSSKEVEPATPDHAARTHHPYGMSKWNHLEDCSGFLSRDGTCEIAEEGTRLHEQMDKIAARLQSGGSAMSVLKELAAEEAMEPDEFWLLAACCKEIDPYLQRGPIEIRREERVYVRNADGSERSHGHYDLLLIFEGGVGVCFDWKFGWLPVPPAERNRQGMGYALGNFHKHPSLTAVGMVFVQPRLGTVTRRVWKKAEQWAMYLIADKIIEKAEFCVKHLHSTNSIDSSAQETAARAMLRVGDYCRYCAFATRCPKLTGLLTTTGYQITQTRIPESFDPERIQTVEQAATVRHFADLIEGAIEPIKKRAMEIALANGNRLEATLPNGEKVVYVVQSRGLDRSLGSAIEIAQVLTNWLTEAEVLGAASLALGKLEDIAVPAMVAMNEAEGGEKLTKTRATEILHSTLEAHGLLTRPDGQIQFLRKQKSVEEKTKTKTKQIKNT